MTCGLGRRTRTRSCQGTGCRGTNSQTQFCNPGTCPSSGWDSWSSWTSCASTCGGGLQFRFRKCLSSCRSGTSYELRSCGRWQCSPPSLDSPQQHTSSNAQFSVAGKHHLLCITLWFSLSCLINIFGTKIQGVGKVIIACHGDGCCFVLQRMLSTFFKHVVSVSARRSGILDSHVVVTN